MADVQANITLVTTGGEESAAEIKMAGDAITNVTRASGGMEEAFQHRFQHIGLMLFAGDALRASGLGRETRMVISSLNLALQEGASVAGISAGGFMLIVTALAALAGIIVKVIQHHKDEADTLQKLADSQSKAYAGYQQEISAINSLEVGGVKLTSTMLAWRDADQAVADDIKSNLLATLEKEEAALMRQRDAIQSSADMHAALKSTVDALKASFEQLMTPFTAAADVLRKWAAGLASLIPMTAQHAALTGDLKLKFDQLSASIAKVRGEQELLKNEGSTDVKAVADATKKAYDEEEKAWEDMASKISAGEKVQQDEIIKLHKAIEKDQEEQFKKQGEAAKKVADQIGSDFGNAFAKMIVEGEDFGQAMQRAFQSMAEQIISDIIRIEVEWMILSSMGFPTSGGFGGFGGGFATGGSRVVDRPTLFMAGDAGPELATFTPVGGGGGGDNGGGGGGIQIGTVQTIVQGVDDPDRIADQVGDKIIQRIRGMGELNFTR